MVLPASARASSTAFCGTVIFRGAGTLLRTCFSGRRTIARTPGSSRPTRRRTRMISVPPLRLTRCAAAGVSQATMRTPRSRHSGCVALHLAKLAGDLKHTRQLASDHRTDRPHAGRPCFFHVARLLQFSSDSFVCFTRNTSTQSAETSVLFLRHAFSRHARRGSSPPDCRLPRPAPTAQRTSRW